MTIRDVESGAVLGRAFVVAWGGRVHLLGFTGEVPLRPVAVPREKLGYWRVTLGFTAAREPDYLRVDSEQSETGPRT